MNKGSFKAETCVDPILLPHAVSPLGRFSKFVLGIVMALAKGGKLVQRIKYGLANESCLFPSVMNTWVDQLSTHKYLHIYKSASLFPSGNKGYMQTRITCCI